ncbi:hypothetical protein C9J03_02380 [Photobacterium gaetbulicola]|uniref:Putative glycosyl transferase family protein n=1 Tax=Photobacterium gaetbulicola Gung47 TaxID=658445 RepID=A0A0C5WCR5_9GAMM|nr:glycosyltransferase family A protein [Photobacterium gaetbulicola]AJR09496.1 putative glycosyl transferase family protein [Photobacterium gaetbulicola Gung47]PSU14290.1 hypothetical protein C9J03_02380 [Photobacterium gaetbulicola]
MTKLVSLILPCFNAANYIERYLTNLLQQKYSNIELIVVNDGSTDNTEDVIFDFFKNKNCRNIQLKYFSQPNSGVASAFNNALKYYTGDFLTWGDPDDFLSPLSISERVSFLNDNPEYGFVRTNANLISPDGHSVVGELTSSDSEYIFDDLIFENNMPVTVGNYLLRSECFKNSLPSQNIYSEARGQNWQLLLPIALKYKCGFINEKLNNIVLRDNSLSRSDTTLCSEIYRCDEHNKILHAVLKDLDVDFSYYDALLNQKYISKKFELSVNYMDYDLAHQYFLQIENKTNVHYIKLLLVKLRIYGFLKLAYMKVFRPI